MARQIQRRAVLAGAAKATAVGSTIAAGSITSLLNGPAMAQLRPTYQNIAFDIHGGGQKIGELVNTQNLAISGKLVVQTNVEIVSNIYSVAANNEETWEAGTLTQLTGVGQNNGTPFQFLISGSGQGLAGFDSRGNDLSADQDAYQQHTGTGISDRPRKLSIRLRAMILTCAPLSLVVDQ